MEQAAALALAALGVQRGRDLHGVGIQFDHAAQPRAAPVDRFDAA